MFSVVAVELLSVAYRSLSLALDGRGQVARCLPFLQELCGLVPHLPHLCGRGIMLLCVGCRELHDLRLQSQHFELELFFTFCRLPHHVLEMGFTFGVFLLGIFRRKSAFLGLILGLFQENFLLGASRAEICKFCSLPRALIQVA